MLSIKKILYPTDFSEYSLAALPYAIELSLQNNAELHCMHVVDETYQYYLSGAYVDSVGVSISPGKIRDNAQKELDKFTAEHLSNVSKLVPKIVSGKPFLEIIKYAKDNKIDLIVLGTHGRSALATMLLGSVAEKVIRKAPCPVLTVRHPKHKFEMP